jgi:hypothetical protein
MWSNGLFGLKRLDLGLRLLRGNLLVDPVDQRQEVEWSQIVDVTAAEIQPPGKQVQVLVPPRQQPVELPGWPSSPGTPVPATDRSCPKWTSPPRMRAVCELALLASYDLLRSHVPLAGRTDKPRRVKADNPSMRAAPGPRLRPTYVCDPTRLRDRRAAARGRDRARPRAGS